MPLTPEHLAYFQALFEGRAEESWNAWFPRHEAVLKRELPRAEFLRLKFHKLDEAEALLIAAGVSYTPDPGAVRRERYHALLHPSVLDERGRPRPEFRRKAYNGAMGQLMDGDFDAARSTLAKYIRRVRRHPAEKQAEELEDLCFDGEMELTLGDPAVGRALLEAAASVPRWDDQVDPATDRARELLQGA
jgi:hypothetical protein